MRSAHRDAVVEGFCGGAIETHFAPEEPTLIMQGPIVVDQAASAKAYDAYHADWRAKIADQTIALSALRPDLLVSDIPYASLAAAARLGVPAIALCSLNWRDVRLAYCGADDAITQTIEDAYQSARVFLQPAPHMPMLWLKNALSIGPIGRRGVNRAAELRQKLGLASGRKLVLVSFGGIAGAPAMDFSHAPDLFFIAPTVGGDNSVRNNSVNVRDIGLPMIDILASVDAVVTKDGYATLVEAAVNGVRILMLERAHWPEAPYLRAWGEAHACFQAIPVESDASTIVTALHALLVRPNTPRVEPHGIQQASAAILRALT